MGAIYKIIFILHIYKGDVEIELFWFHGLSFNYLFFYYAEGLQILRSGERKGKRGGGRRELVSYKIIFF